MSESEQEQLIRAAHNRFRGRYAGFIEAHNLPLKVERSLISVMKSLSYDLENDLVKEICK